MWQVTELFHHYSSLLLHFCLWTPSTLSPVPWQPICFHSFVISRTLYKQNHPIYSLLKFTFFTKQTHLRCVFLCVFFCITNVCVFVTQLCLTLRTPWTVARQAPLSMEFSRQEYWSGLPFPFPGDLPNPGIEPGFPALRQVLYWATREAQ